VLDAHEGTRRHSVEWGCPGPLLVIHDGEMTFKLVEFDNSISFELTSSSIAGVAASWVESSKRDQRQHGRFPWFFQTQRSHMYTSMYVNLHATNWRSCSISHCLKERILHSTSGLVWEIVMTHHIPEQDRGTNSNALEASCASSFSRKV